MKLKNQTVILFLVSENLTIYIETKHSWQKSEIKTSPTTSNSNEAFYFVQKVLLFAEFQLHEFVDKAESDSSDGITKND